MSDRPPIRGEDPPMTCEATEPSAADRRQQILALALGEASRRRRRRRVGRLVRFAGVAAAVAVAWAALPRGPTINEPTSPTLAHAPSPPPSPVVSPPVPPALVQVIEPRAEGYAHLLVDPNRPTHVQVLSDDELLDALAALDRPAALVRIGGKPKLLLAAGG